MQRLADNLRGFVDHTKKIGSNSVGCPTFLLPVPYRSEREAEPVRKFRLGQFQLSSDCSHVDRFELDRARGRKPPFRNRNSFAGENIPVFLLALIDKGQRANLSKAEVNELAKELSVLAENYRRGRRQIASLVKNFSRAPAKPLRYRKCDMRRRARSNSKRSKRPQSEECSN